MMITSFGQCPICGATLHHDVAFSAFSCPSGHYTVRITVGATGGTATISLVSPQKPPLEVPQVFQDAFPDKGVLEP